MYCNRKIHSDDLTQTLYLCHTSYVISQLKTHSVVISQNRQLSHWKVNGKCSNYSQVNRRIASWMLVSMSVSLLLFATQNQNQASVEITRSLWLEFKGYQGCHKEIFAMKFSLSHLKSSITSNLIPLCPIITVIIVINEQTLYDVWHVNCAMV